MCLAATDEPTLAAASVRRFRFAFSADLRNKNVKLCGVSGLSGFVSNNAPVLSEGNLHGTSEYISQFDQKVPVPFPLSSR